LWHGDLPSAAELETFRAQLGAERALPGASVALLRECARARVDPMDALRIAAGTISLVSDDPAAIVARVPTIAARFWLLCSGGAPAPRRPRRAPARMRARPRRSHGCPPTRRRDNLARVGRSRRDRGARPDDRRELLAAVLGRGAACAAARSRTRRELPLHAER